MSANSINVGRVIPQSFYYLWTSLQLKSSYPNQKIVYSIPSGNLGNLTGGLIAKQMGAPIDRFVIGNNANNPFVDYLSSAKYTPRPSVPTLSNAMDIGRPNNFPRILKLYSDNYDAITSICWGASFTDTETERHLRKVYLETGYLMCPHTTVGHLAMKEFSKDVEHHVFIICRQPSPLYLTIWTRLENEIVPARGKHALPTGLIKNRSFGHVQYWKKSLRSPPMP